MRGAVRNIYRKSRLAWRYAWSAAVSRRWAHAFEDVDCFCLFLGYPRSGHSLVGSLLDAHPDVVMAHEANVIKLVRYGFSREQIFVLLLENSRKFTLHGREYTGYSYLVPNQWQGRFRRLRVIGDKHGDFALPALARRPDLIQKMTERVRTPLRFIHVVRHPFDNIATIALRDRRNRGIRRATEFYFSLVAQMEQIEKLLAPQQVLDVYLDVLTREREREIARWAAFLGVEADEEWLKAGAQIVFDSPRKTRCRVQWPEGLQEEIRERSRRCPFLARFFSSEEGDG